MATTYRVDGMTCGGCANSVEKAIVELAPGASVSVDLAAKTVTVENGGDATVIAQAVDNAGFEFKGAA